MNTFSMEFNWKAFDVDLYDFSLFAQSNSDNKFAGMSADSKLTLWFTEMPSEQKIMSIQQHWESLSESAEAAKIEYRDKLERAAKHASDQLPYVDFASMIPAEKKIFMNRSLSRQDKEDLLVKYPNV